MELRDLFTPAELAVLEKVVEALDKDPTLLDNHSREVRGERPASTPE